MKLLLGLFLILIGIGILDMLSTRESKVEYTKYDEAYETVKDSVEIDTIKCTTCGN